MRVRQEQAQEQVALSVSGGIFVSLVKVKKTIE